MGLYQLFFHTELFTVCYKPTSFANLQNEMLPMAAGGNTIKLPNLVELT